MNKVTDEQLNKIQTQQKELNAIVHDLGVMETQKHGLLHNFAVLNKEVDDFKVELESQYGPVNINIDDGIYTNIEASTTEEPTPVEPVIAEPVTTENHV
jgi:hypothetical protein